MLHESGHELIVMSGQSTGITLIAQTWGTLQYRAVLVVAVAVAVCNAWLMSASVMNRITSFSAYDIDRAESSKTDSTLT